MSLVLDFEGLTSNGDGTYSLTNKDYPVFDGSGLGRGVEDRVNEAGVTSAMLKITLNLGATHYAGLVLAEGFDGTNFIGDGSQNITMTVYSDETEDGTLTLSLETNDTDANGAPIPNYVITETIVTGVNNLVFDVSGAPDRSWEKVFI